MSFNIKTIGSDGIVGNHPDVTNWLNTISLVGGSASSTTISALNTFCNSIDAAGLRNKFYRLNLFCGNNLASCLVPLFVNISYTTIPAFGFGYSIDQNIGFVSGDYNETGVSGGLQGDGVGKQLIVGLTPDQIGSSTGHMSAYIPTVTGTTSARLMGAGTISPGALYQLERSSGSSGIQGSYGDSGRAINAGTQSGHYLITRTSPTSALTMYANGSATSTDNLTANVRTSSFDIRIFTYNFSNSITNFWPYRILSYSLGLPMNSIQASAFYNAMQTFQTALLRHRASADPIFSSITNVDAQLWIDNAYANGGSVSLSTATAVNTFCNTIDSAGLRSKFYRLNLFCGDNLFAALVPLYRGPSNSGTQFGGSTDTNFNFVAADYVESGSTGGLKGNGSNKGLLTGLTQSMIGSLYDIHCSTYFETSDGSSATMRYCGCFATNHTLMNETSSNTIGGRVGDNFYFSGTLSASPAGNQGGHHITSRTLQNDARHFRNGVSIVQRTDSITATTETSQQYGVFGAATDNIGGFNSLTSRRLRSYSFGLGFSTSEALAYYNALQTFQTSLGRNV